MRKIFLIAVAVFCSALVVSAQPRPNVQTAPSAADQPATYPAKYEGGIYGSTGREKGFLKLDEENQRVVFYRKGDTRELFSIPYDAMILVYPDSKVTVSQTGNVVSRFPLPGAGLAGLLDTRHQILIINFDDPEIDAHGNANFKFDDKKLLLTFINALGTQAKMKQRGDAFYRAKKNTF